MSKLFDLIFDALSDDVIDCEFIQTDLKDINLTDEERTQTAFYDSLAENTNNNKNWDTRPMGKRVY